MREQMCLTVFLVYLYVWTAVSENSCEFNQTCSATFMNSDIQLMGCPAVHANDSSKPMASLNCLNNIHCKAIICISSTAFCSTCTGDQISSLTFNVLGTYLKRKIMRLNMENDPITLGIDQVYVLPDRLAKGDLVYIKTTLLKYDNIQTAFLVDADNINYQFRARCNNDCSDQFNCTSSLCAVGKYVKISSRLNRKWSTSDTADFNYPFTLNQQFELHFLVLSNSVICYIDRKYYMTYNTPYPAQSVYGIRVRGTVKIHEFSV